MAFELTVREKAHLQVGHSAECRARELRPDVVLARVRRREKETAHGLVDIAERERYYAKPGMRPSKEPDPNSPFAKLAALKQQLEDNAKR